jgi:hypothetical protein
MATVNADITVSTKITHNSTLLGGTVSGTPQLNYSSRLTTTDLTDAYEGSRTVTGAETLDVRSGLSNVFGTAIVLATVKGITIHNTHASNSLVVGGGANALFGSDQFTILAGKCLYLDTSIATSGSVKNLLVTPSGASTTYDIIIFGA